MEELRTDPPAPPGPGPAPGALPLPELVGRPALVAAIWKWAHRYPAVVVVLVCLVCLGPFAGKAFHIDDPLFLWTAQHIQKRPLDPYGFRVNWYYDEMPMYEVTKNPPLACYSLALAGGMLGWGEVPLHLAFLVWPVGVAWGTYRLAERLCARPLLAALTGVLTPVLLVSATNVMCDVMMLCLWVWAVVWWERGLSSGRWQALVLAGLLVGLCALTKYYGMSLIPLLLVYGLARRRPGLWLLALLVPVAILAGYQWRTYELYDRGLLSDAVGYASQLREELHMKLRPLAQLRTGLCFVGGGLACPLFFLPLFWRPRRTLIGLAIVGLTLVLGLEAIYGFVPSWYNQLSGAPEDVLLQGGLSVAAALLLLLVAGQDAWTRRDAGSLLLLLWVLGTLLFAAFVNWTINGRSVLPLAPAAGILLVRQLDRRWTPTPDSPRWWLALPLAPAAALGLAVAWADSTLANSARTAARKIRTEFGAAPSTLWFQGHWGFQYYMEQANPTVGPPGHILSFRFRPHWAGDRVFDLEESRLQPGDRLVVPSNNTYCQLPPTDAGPSVEQWQVPSCRWLGTMCKSLRAGFYADNYVASPHDPLLLTVLSGPLPYTFGRVPPDSYQVYVIHTADPPVILARAPAIPTGPL